MQFQKIWSIVCVVFMIVISINFVNSAVANRLDLEIADDNTESSLILKSADSSFDYKTDYRMHVPVRHFARHGLCRRQVDKQHFYKALKTKLCHIKEMFVATLVESLCRHRGSFLDKWVSELFDVDGDGMITHYEKRIFETND